jgi:SAM-dependent methyltransferase
MTQGSYGALCAEFYDLDKPTAPANELRRLLDFAAKAEGPILEPMCGTGRFLVPLLEAGYPVTGFDASPQMLHRCREKCQRHGLVCPAVEATFDSFSWERYGLIMIPACSFCLLTEESQIVQALSLMARSLLPSGRLILDVQTVNSADPAPGLWGGRWVRRPDGTQMVLSTLSQYESPIETILCRYESWIDRHIDQTEVEELRLRLYRPEELEALLVECGFRILNRTSGENEILYECGVA